jgi:hypothetical protein
MILQRAQRALNSARHIELMSKEAKERRDRIIDTVEPNAVRSIDNSIHQNELPRRRPPPTPTLDPIRVTNSSLLH